MTIYSILGNWILGIMNIQSLTMPDGFQTATVSRAAAMVIVSLPLQPMLIPAYYTSRHITSILQLKSSSDSYIKASVHGSNSTANPTALV